MVVALLFHQDDNFNNEKAPNHLQISQTFFFFSEILPWRPAHLIFPGGPGITYEASPITLNQRLSGPF